RDALNWHLKPHPVAVLAAVPAPEGWHPRFSAIGRSYCYAILDRPAPPALRAGRVWHVPRRLDAEGMQGAARLLLGRHDFSSFRAAACQAKSPVKTLDRLDVIREGDCVRILAAARSFLHHQVRNIVGTLKLVGEGRWNADDIARILAARDRRVAGPTAPAQGLCLSSARYGVELFAVVQGAGDHVE
ncbi:MAG: tRNA pseudouridine synthase A, partial [Alphaproteobacteria bacterium]|nr:tRNA pseudouridine synthase A [Alphaproteobacteria bacterium]